MKEMLQCHPELPGTEEQPPGIAVALERNLDGWPLLASGINIRMWYRTLESLLIIRHGPKLTA